MKCLFDTCIIVGPGLIGASIGLGLKKQRAVNKVVGIGHRQESIDAAVKRRAIDEGSLDISNGVYDADLAIIATPVSLIPQKIKAIVPHLKDGTILTDVGSAKSFIMKEFENMCSDQTIDKNVHINFIGGHPIAGSENRGVEFADPDLFVNSICVLTPGAVSSKASIKKLTDMWELLGCNVLTMPPEEHDAILATTSHLPQIAAFTIANTIKDNHWKFSGGGLKDITRIASSDPTLWLDICNQNQTNIVHAIDLFIKELSGIKDALQKNDQSEILRIFKNAKDKRDGFYKDNK